MPQTGYQVMLSTGGNVAVTVTADDPAEMESALAWAGLAYKHLVGGQGKNDGRIDDQVTADQVQEGKDEEAPICAIHKVAMVKVEGRFGHFWSCHERNADGSFCTYKPDRPDSK